jgi:UDP-glucose 4-epimerase
MVHHFEKESGQSVPFKIAARRPGDAPEVWADASHAAKKIAFSARRGASEMCRDTWRWQSTNPIGYNK